MKTWTVSAFGRELFKIEMVDRVTVDDVVRQMMAAHDVGDDAEDEDCYEEIAEGLIPCESCGEMLAPDDEEDDTDIRFTTMTERLVWDASQNYPEPPPELFE